MQSDHSGKTKLFSLKLMRQIEERLKSELLQKGYSMFEVLAVQHDLKPSRKGHPPREDNKSLVIILLPPDTYDSENRANPNLCRNELKYQFHIRDDGSITRFDYFVKSPTGKESVFAKYHGKDLDVRLTNYIIGTLKEICRDLEIEREIPYAHQFLRDN